ncbi:hypothetical protein VX159_01295 [Dechloromonas sp. ZY10]|uniref:hypothetical protein n=1 Tax=Dechloromonas aquae TaxID=2664436 RepID=UPI003527E939
MIAPISAFVYTTAMKKYPLSFISLCLLGVAAAIPGLGSVLGFGGWLHPLLEDPMAGLAFIVSALALFGSAAFPLILRRLQEAEQ